MSSTCADGLSRAACSLPAGRAAPMEAPVETLAEIIRRYGTPTYAYNLEHIRSQIAKLSSHLPAGVAVYYSLKANGSLGLCRVIAECGLGADVASAGELATALAAGFPSERILVTGPDKSPAMLAQLRSAPEAILSIDSPSELEILAGQPHPPTPLSEAERGARENSPLSASERGARGERFRVLLRLRPDFCSYAACAAGPDSRFGVLFEELPQCREFLRAPGVRIIGFHVFAGSQVLDAGGLVHHLRGALDLCRRAAAVLDLTPEIIDLGGGFGVPYGPEDQELDLRPVVEELARVRDGVTPAKVILELGRYLVAQSGWYLTTVISRQTRLGRKAVVVDGGTHQRADLCGLGLRGKAFAPILLREGVRAGDRESVEPTDVLGCLSLPSDVLAEAVPLPPLRFGDVLAFANAGAYGLSASPVLFHGHRPPAEVAFEVEGTTLLSPLQ